MQITRRTAIQGSLATCRGGGVRTRRVRRVPRAAASIRPITARSTSTTSRWTGTTAWTGTHEDAERLPAPTDPFRTVHRARDAVRSRVAGRPDQGDRGRGTRGHLLPPRDAGVHPRGTPAPRTHPIFWTASGDVVLSGGRVIDAAWTISRRDRLGDDRGSVAVPHAVRQRRAADPGPLPQRGCRPSPARGYLYHGGQNANLIMSGLATAGDFVEHSFTVADPAATTSGSASPRSKPDSSSTSRSRSTALRRSPSVRSAAAAGTVR